MVLVATSRARYTVCPHMSTVHIMGVGGVRMVSTTMRQQYTWLIAAMRVWCSFLLIYPDYTMERESLLIEPCVPPLHLSISLSHRLSYCRVNDTVSSWPDMQKSIHQLWNMWRSGQKPNGGSRDLILTSNQLKLCKYRETNSIVNQSNAEVL